LDILDGEGGDDAGGVDAWHHVPEMDAGGYFFAAGAGDPQPGGVFGDQVLACVGGFDVAGEGKLKGGVVVKHSSYFCKVGDTGLFAGNN
jgi:hypothetical protein